MKKRFISSGTHFYENLKQTYKMWISEVVNNILARKERRVQMSSDTGSLLTGYIWLQP